MSLTYKKEDNIAYLEFDQKDSKVNVLSFDVLDQMNKYLDQIKEEPKLRALVILSRKKDVFIAGADIKQIEKITKPQEGEEKARLGQDLFNKIEDLNIPTIALIDGVALGGGCELAISCDYRIATFNEKVKIGLPEVNLGILPGFGGTYRLPRIIGLSEGLKMILSGRPISGSDAYRKGLIDALYPQTGLKENVIRFIEEIEGKPAIDKYKRKKFKGLMGLMDTSILGQAFIIGQSRKSVLEKTKGFYPSPLQALDVVKKNFYLDRQKGLDVEAKAFGYLVITNICKNLIQVFYMSEKYKKLSIEGADSVSAIPIAKAGVLGAGIMGGGIAQLFSVRGIWTRLKDINHDAVAKGFQAAAKITSQAAKRRKMTKAEANNAMARITGTLDYSGFQTADIVIEAVVEKMEVKKKVFKELSAAAKPEAILATNTSALSVTEMARETKDPSKVIGFHFFNPVHRMPLIEVITTDQTSKETIVSSLNLVKRLGKTPILVKDSTGFLVNRILLGYINEAGRILEEGVSLQRVDQIMTDFGMPMGPFTLSDEVGLDVGIKVLQILENSFGERFKPVKVFEDVLNAGLLGKKSNKGFYIHGKKRVPNGEIDQFLKKTSSPSSNDEDYLDRMILIMLNEAAMCLEEGIISEADAVDVGMIFGTGFPPFHGGLLRYADACGIDSIVNKMENMKNSLNADRFRPCSCLNKLKEDKKGFYS